MDITHFEAFEKLKKGKTIFLDIRTREEIDQGFIRNSEFMDFFDPDFQKQIEELDPKKEYVVYCRSGGRSAKAVELMKTLGFSQVYNLEGGILAWKAEGFEVEMV